jgi:hypothetical protein
MSCEVATGRSQPEIANVRLEIGAMERAQKSSRFPSLVDVRPSVLCGRSEGEKVPAGGLEDDVTCDGDGREGVSLKNEQQRRQEAGADRGRQRFVCIEVRAD